MTNCLSRLRASRATPTSGFTSCSARAVTTVPDRRRSMADGAVRVPGLAPGWVHSHSTNITRVPAVTARSGTPVSAQNLLQLAQSWA
ncbi:hypothetical protein ACQF36_29715 [Streptomyces sp. Marseille-Q5077]|uniref:hypothetical protein n=1 Tax=Streptomyces sp. Marseille-Q5077 TaxID=3418995 RepID=UPI003CFC9C63